VSRSAVSEPTNPYEENDDEICQLSHRCSVADPHRQRMRLPRLPTCRDRTGSVRRQPRGALPRPRADVRRPSGRGRSGAGGQRPAAIGAGRAARGISKGACPGTAICWACLAPGAGHLYTGETGRGALLAGTAAGSLLAGTLLSSGGGTCRATNPEDQGRCTYDHENHRMVEPTNRTPLYVGAAVAAAGWIYGIVDAGSSARRMNASSGVAVGPFDAQPQPGVRTTAAGEPALGIGVRLTW
jgi:hypothetical protein